MDKMFKSYNEYKEYEDDFIHKWKSIFDISSNKYKTYRKYKDEILNDYQPIIDYIVYSYLLEINEIKEDLYG